MSESLKAGDPVCLKSDGMQVTIAEILDGKAICHWFVKDVLFERTFPLTSLQLDDGSDGFG
jgi:uncharacterized protein YodC (DUF2158 family)